MPNSVVVADVNGDGKPDLRRGEPRVSAAITVANGTVGVLLGNGDGTFQTAVYLRLGWVSTPDRWR